MRVNCRGMSVEKAIRILRRKTDRNGLKLRIKELEFYEKPTARRKRLKAAAVKRQQKITSEQRKFEVRKPKHQRRR